MTPVLGFDGASIRPVVHPVCRPPGHRFVHGQSPADGVAPPGAGAEATGDTPESPSRTGRAPQRAGTFDSRRPRQDRTGARLPARIPGYRTAWPLPQACPRSCLDTLRPRSRGAAARAVAALQRPATFARKSRHACGPSDIPEPLHGPKMAAIPIRNPQAPLSPGLLPRPGYGPGTSGFVLAVEPGAYLRP